MLTLPDSLLIGPITYQVILVPSLRDDKGERLDGQTKLAEAKILLDADLQDWNTTLTLWHELLHIVFAHAGLPDNEQNVTAMSYILMQIFQENPSLLPVGKTHAPPSPKVP